MFCIRVYNNFFAILMDRQGSFLLVLVDGEAEVEGHCVRK